jgi:hypothetical protein
MAQRLAHVLHRRQLRRRRQPELAIDLRVLEGEQAARAVVEVVALDPHAGALDDELVDGARAAGRAERLGRDVAADDGQVGRGRVGQAGVQDARQPEQRGDVRARAVGQVDGLTEDHGGAPVDLARGVAQPRPDHRVLRGERGRVGRGGGDPVPGDGVVVVAHDGHAVGRLVEPAPRVGEPHARRAAAAGGDLVGIAQARRVDAQLPRRVPREAPEDRGVLDEVLEVERQRQHRVDRSARVQGIDQAPAQVALELRRARGELGAHEPSHELVRADAVAQGLDAGVLAQPGVAALGVDRGQHRGQQPGRGDARERGDRQDGAALVGRLGVEERCDERVDVPGRARRENRGLRVGGERQRERQAAGPRDHARSPHRVADAAGG